MTIPLSMTVAMRQLRAWPRRRAFRWLRISLVLAGTGFLSILQGYRYESGSDLGLAIFRMLANVSGVGSVVIGVFMGVSVVRQEQRGRTLGMLLITDVTTGALIRGLAGGAWLSGQVILLGAAPLMLLVISFGGVGGAQMLWLLALLEAWMTLGILAGIAGTLQARPGLVLGRRRPNLIAIVLILVLWPLLGISSTWPIWPFRSLRAVIRGDDYSVVLVHVALVLLIALVLLRVATAAFVKAVCRHLEPATGPPPREFARKQAAQSIWRREIDSTVGERLSKRIVGNPLIWKDSVIHTTRKVWPWAVIAWTPTVTMAVFGIWGPYLRDLVFGATIFSGYMVAMMLPVVGLIRVAGYFRREHEAGTLDTLMLAGFQPGRIAFCKVAATLRPLTPLIALEVAAFVLLVTQFESPVAMVAVGVSAFGMLAMGLAMGIHAGLVNGGTLMVGFYVVLLGVVWVSTFTFTSFTDSILAYAVVPWVAAGGFLLLSWWTWSGLEAGRR